MESIPKVEPPSTDAATGQERSTISFPYSDQDAGVEVVTAVYEAGGTACEFEQLAAALKMEAKGGGFRTKVNTAVIFGLVTTERGGRVILTDLGRRLTDPAKEKQARAESFLAVPLFSKVYEEFKGSPLPPQAGLERAIVGMGVIQTLKERARQVLMRSAKQAGYLDQAPDRLTKPIFRDAPASSDDSKDKERKDEERRGSSGGSSGGEGGGGGKHPLIQGLLITLPEPGAEWTAVDRMNWLTMANSIFKMIYKAAGSDTGDVELTIKK